MAATLLLDRNIEGTYLDNSPTFVRLVRCGIVKDIDLPATGFDPTVMIKALAAQGMPQLGDPHPSLGSIAPVQRHIITGRAGNQANVQIFYETPQFGAAQATVFIQGGTGLVSETSGLDGSGAPIWATYTVGGATTTKHFSINRLTPMRVLKVVAVKTSLPDATVHDCVGRVNNQVWQGLPIGYWLCDGVSFEANNAALTEWRIEGSFRSRVWRDWKEYAIFKDEHGEVPESVITGASLSNIRNAIGATYAFTTNTSVNGFVTIGFYGVRDFFAVFGI